MDLTNDELAAAAAPARQRHGFRFHGHGGEYFRIWIVNVSLTIMTLGIYSAWAKVRRNRYIYGSLELDGSRFEYLAQPVKILRGRFIALTALVVYIVAQYFFTWVGILLFFLITLLTPLLIVRSRMFNMRYTAYRNIRFGFKPAYGDAYSVIFGYGLLSALTLGLAVPYAHYKRNGFIVENTRFGRLLLHFKASPRDFFLAYGLGTVLAFVLYPPVSQLAGQLKAANDPASFSLVLLLPILITAVFYFGVAQLVNACVLRATTNGMALGEDDSVVTGRLGCDWTLLQMLGIYLTNILAIVCSFGLLIPWAKMRALRYQLNHTWVDVDGSMDDVIAGQAEDISAVGEELGEVFDVDIGL